MTKLDDIFESDVIDKLKTITITNGFSANVSALDGYLVHYVDDLHDEVDGLSFPCVAAQLSADSVDLDNNKKGGVVSHVVKIMGAVSVKDRTLVNRNLNALVFDVRKVLSIDNHDAKSKRSTKALSLEVGGAKFNLPNSSDQYAFFEMDLIINYKEKWE